MKRKFAWLFIFLMIFGLINTTNNEVHHDNNLIKKSNYQERIEENNNITKDANNLLITYNYDSIFLQSGNYSFSIKYSVLKSVYINDNFQYISCLPKQANEKITFISIFEYGFKHFLSLQYLNDNNDFITTNAEISEAVFNFIKNSSNKVVVGKDEVANKIIDFQVAYTSFYKETISEKNRIIDNPATQVTYDNYTNNDGIIHDYVDDYLTEEVHGTAVCENRIIDIVPKNLFKSIGDYICIGKEYGFYINTTADYLFSGDYCSDVLVFDIDYQTPYTSTYLDETGYLMIRPLFQYRYATRCRSNHNNFDLIYYTNENDIVVTHLHFNSSNYYIANPKIAVTIENANELNYYDNTYSSSNDNGAFFISQLNQGLFMKYNPNPNYNPDTITNFANLLSFCASTIGFINTKAGILFSILAFVTDILATHEQTVFNNLNQSNVYQESITFKNNPNKQIEKYGHYIRSLLAEFPSNNNVDFLTTRNNCFCKNEFRIANVDNYGNPQRLYGGISLDIYGPNPWYLAPTNPGPGIMGHADISVLYDEFAIYAKNIINESVTIGFAGGFVFYEFEPGFSTDYIIETSGNSDTYIHVYDYNGNELCHDDDSGNGTNARINWFFVTGQTYYIKIRLYSSLSTGGFDVSYGKDCPSVYQNIPVTCFVADGDYQLYKFIPPTTKTYSISLVRSDDESDPMLFLYDDSETQIGYNDDYIDEDSFLQIQLVASNIYYIKCQMTISFYSGYLTLTVV